jgi:hypothetical protein
VLAPVMMVIYTFLAPGEVECAGVLSFCGEEEIRWNGFIVRFPSIFDICCKANHSPHHWGFWAVILPQYLKAARDRYELSSDGA